MESLVSVAIWVVLVFGGALLRLIRHLRGQAPREDESGEVARGAPRTVALPAHVAAELATRADELDARVTALVQAARSNAYDEHGARLAEILADYISERAFVLRRSLEAPGRGAEALRSYLRHLEIVERAVAGLIAQRAVPATRELLRDVERLVRACQDGLLEPVREGTLPLPAEDVVVALAPDDVEHVAHLQLAELPGLILVPAALDRDLRRWPEVAHAVARRVLDATPGLLLALRSAAGVPGASYAARPLHAGRDDGARQLAGLFIAELAADALGALCLGAAYGQALCDRVAAPDAPDRTARVRVDASGRYLPEPPALLRVMAVARALEAAGDVDAAASLRAAWSARHGEQPVVLVPVAGAERALPRAAVEAAIGDVAAAVVTARLPALGSMAFADVPALQRSAHRVAEVRLSADELLAGRVPRGSDPRDVVAAAIHAVLARPDRHDAILALTRCAIGGRGAPVVATGTNAVRPGAAPRSSARRAFVLHTVLAPPPGSGPGMRTRVRRRGAGVLARPAWP